MGYDRMVPQNHCRGMEILGDHSTQSHYQSNRTRENGERYGAMGIEARFFDAVEEALEWLESI